MPNDLRNAMLGAPYVPQSPRAMSLAQRVQNVYGLDPNASRLNVLPKYDGGEWTAPEWVYDLAKASVLPGHVLQGGAWTPEDVTNMAMTVGGAGVTGASIGNSVPRGAVLGANVFQGSPHKYGPEGARESLKHIGKGEGAQAYGWGRYDAGAREVAEKYKRDLSETVEGIKSAQNIEERAAQMALTFGDGTPAGAIKWLDEKVASGSKHLPDDLTPEVVETVKARFKSEEYRPGGHLYTHDLPDEDIARYLDWDAPLSEQPESVQIALGLKRDAARDAQLKAELSDVEAQIKALQGHTDGETLEQMLDRAFSASPEENAILGGLERRRTALKDALETPTGRPDLVKQAQNYGFYNEDPTGRELYESFAAYGDKEKTSRMLAEAGIPGLKYYDGMSRGDKVQILPRRTPDGEEGYLVDPGWKDPNKRKMFPTKEEAERYADEMYRTRNYVTWDQDVLNRMKLLERNGERF